jgi:hypothetical protein
VDQLLSAGATGKGQKIAIVNAYGDTTIQTDLNNFCGYYGIPSTTVQVIYRQGKPIFGNGNWALETASDVEWAHAIAPNATLILSVAKSASLGDLLGAVDAAVNAGAGLPESELEPFGLVRPAAERIGDPALAGNRAAHRPWARGLLTFRRSKGSHRSMVDLPVKHATNYSLS